MKSIFVTTGTQLPFDRLLEAVDLWASTNKNVKVIAQACESEKVFSNIELIKMLGPKDYQALCSSVDVIVGHAGMGTIITAHENEIPIVIMPRRFDLGEHRNDHQMSTVKKFKDTEGVYIAQDLGELLKILNSKQLLPCKNVICESRKQLIGSLNKLIFHSDKY